MAHLSPIHSWKLITPCVVLAVKLGAISLMRSDIIAPQNSDENLGGAQLHCQTLEQDCKKVCGRTADKGENMACKSRLIEHDCR
jgi:hypothetical protein